MNMQRAILGLAACMPLPAAALDVEAISRSIVEADPWGKNADTLPLLLAWLGLILLIAVTLKFVYREYDRWRTARKARQAALRSTDDWILEMGRLLDVSPPDKLRPGATPGLWRQYRHSVKMALEAQLRRSRELASQAAERTSE
jgi:hypothetical protein